MSEGRAATRFELRLRTEDLRSFGGWTRPAKRFLAEAGSTIDIANVVDRYFAHVEAFHEWFEHKQREVHGVGPDLYQHLLTHGASAVDRPEVRELEERIAALEEKKEQGLTLGDLEEAFDPVLSILDSRVLLLCKHDAAVWVRRALVGAESRFKIGSELKSRILGLVNVEEERKG